MPLATVNGHVLLPHYPDWSRNVQRARVWQTSVDRALTGFESRQALRPKPRERLSFRVESRDADDLTLLLGRVDAALKAGLACVPSWGRGIPLVAASGDSVELARDAWADLQTGSFLFLAEPGARETFEVAEVLSVSGDTVTLADPLGSVWGAGHWAWPLLFGRPAFSALEQRTDWHAALTISLSQLAVQPESPEEPPPPPPEQTPATITFTWWLNAAAVPDPGSPTRITFDHWLDDAPVHNLD